MGMIDQVTGRSLYRMEVYNASPFSAGSKIRIFGGVESNNPLIAECTIKKIYPKSREIEVTAPIPNEVKVGDYVIVGGING